MTPYHQRLDRVHTDGGGSHMDDMPQGFAQIESDALAGRLSRRALIKRATALGLSAPLVAVLLAACGGGSAAPTATMDAAAATKPAAGGTAAPSTAPTAPGGSSTAPTAAASAGQPVIPTPAQSAGKQPKSGGTLKVSSNSLAQDTLNQHETNNTNSLQTARHVLDTLAIVDPTTGDVKPFLAKSWQVSPDGLEYTFTLVDGVTFHDGTPCNAAAVKANIDVTMAPDAKKNFAFSAFGGDKYAGTQVIDEKTVKITLKTPFPSLLAYLGGPGTGFDSPDAMKMAGKDYGVKTLVGTGPFKFMQWVPNSNATLVRNPDYKWQSTITLHQGPAYLDKIEYRDIVEPATRAAALQNGDIHVAQLSEGQVAQFKGNKDLDIVTVPKAGTTRMYLMNTKQAPTNDPKVRNAVIAAVDRKALIQLPAWAGIGRPGLAPLPANMMPKDLYEGLKQYDTAYDPAKAGQLLDEVGWTMGKGGVRQKNGQDLVLKMIAVTDDIPNIEPVGGFLGKVGIKIDIQSGDFNFLLAAAAKDPFNITLFSGSGYDSPGLVHRFFNSKGIFSYFVSDPELDKLTDAAIGAPSREKMWPILGQAMQKVMEMNVGLMGWEQDYVFGVRKAVKNVTFNEWGFPYYYDTWLDE